MADGTTSTQVDANAGATAGSNAPLFQPLIDTTGVGGNMLTIDLDDLFNEMYYDDFEPNPVVSGTSIVTDTIAAPTTTTTTTTTAPAPILVQSSTPATEEDIRKRKADAAGLHGSAGGTTTTTTTTTRAGGDAAAGTSSSSISVTSTGSGTGANNFNTKDLTEAQKVERRERNREHAKRSRLRKKFLLESLQEQIHGLEEQIEGLKKALKEEAPAKADELIARICGDKEKFTPLPMPSGFGPVKTIMEPDFRLMSALSGSQQNFAISDPTLPDNPIVYCSQGFLDLTGYTLDQVLGRNCRFLQGPGTDQSAVEVIRKGIAEGVDTSVCLLNYKADGTPFWNQFFVAALRDAENNIVNYVGVQCEVSQAVVEKHKGDQNKKPKAAPSN